MALDESKDTKDTLYDIDKVKVIISENVLNMVNENTPLKIDFHKSKWNEGFTIDTGSSC